MINAKKLFAKLLRANPIGRIELYAGATAPRGWLLCNGQTVSRTTYSELFAIIGTNYGAGDGSTTFGLPDLRGRVPVGTSSSYALGGQGGVETVTLTAAQSGIPAHGHGFTQPSVAIGSHQHIPNTGTSTTEYFVTTEESGANNTKVAYSSSGNRWVDGQASESHFHHRVATTFADLGTKTATGGAVQNNTAANASAAHNNMQPYLVLNYIIYAGGGIS